MATKLFKKHIRITGAVFPVLVFIFLPLIYAPSLFDPAQISRLIIGYFIICVYVMYLLLSKHPPQLIPFNQYHIFWLLYLAACFVSIINTPDLSNAIFEILKILFLVILILMILFSLKSKNISIEVFYKIITISAICQPVIAVLQKLFKLEIFGFNNSLDPYAIENMFLGTMTHHGLFSIYMLFMIPFCALCIHTSKGIWRYLGIISFFICLLLIIITKNRASWIALVLSTLFTIIIAIKTNKNRMSIIRLIYKRRNQIAVFGTIFAFFTLTIIAFDYKDFINHIHTLICFDSIGRIFVWQKTIGVILSHPLFGVGLGNWRLYVPKMNSVVFQRTHNDYLAILAECGLIGLIFYMLIIIYLYYKLIRIIKSDDRYQYTVGLAMFFALTSYQIVSFFWFPKERVMLLACYALIQGIIIAIGDSNKNMNKWSLNINALLVLFLVISILAIWFNINRYVCERVVKKAVTEESISLRNRRKALEKVNPLFYKIDPVSNPISYHIGQIYLKEQNYQKAQKFFLKAYNTYAFNTELLVNLGTVYEINNNRKEAKKFYSKALEIDSTNQHARINWAIIEYKDKNYTKSSTLINFIQDEHFIADEELKIQYKVLKTMLDQ